MEGNITGTEHIDTPISKGKVANKCIYKIGRTQVQSTFSHQWAAVFGRPFQFVNLPSRQINFQILFGSWAYVFQIPRLQQYPAVIRYLIKNFFKQPI